MHTAPSITHLQEELCKLKEEKAKAEEAYTKYQASVRT